MGDPERAHRLRPLPGRLQRRGDDARGQGQARPLAQPPGGRRRLALRQGPLRVPAPLRGRPRHRAARCACAGSGLEPVELGARARRGRDDAARRRGPRRDRVLGHGDASSRPTRSAKLLRVGLGSHTAVLPEATSSALDAFRLPLCGDRRRRARRGRSATSRSRSARRSSTSGCRAASAERRRGRHVRADRAPCRRRPAARAGRLPRARRARERARQAPPRRASAPSWSGRAPGGGGGARLAELAHALGWEGKPGLRRLPPAGDAERPRRRRGLGGRLRRGGRRARPDRRC